MGAFDPRFVGKLTGRERKISVVGIPMNILLDKLAPDMRAWLVSTDAESGTVEVKMVVDNKMRDIRTVRF